MHNLEHSLLNLLKRISGTPAAAAMMADLAVTAVDVSLIGAFCTIRQILNCAVVIKAHSSPTGTAEENARQQGGAGAAQAARAITRRGRNAFLQNLFAQIEAEIIDNS